MELLFDPKEQEGVARGREGFSCRLKTDDQHFEIVVLGGFCEREINRSGTYGDVRNACCMYLVSANRMKYLQAEEAINNVFKERVGMSMHVKAEGMKARLKELGPDQKQLIGERANDIEPVMQDGTLLSFNRVLSSVAAPIARELNVPELGVTNIMRDEFEAAHPGKEFYEWGKELNQKHYQPDVEELKADREAEKAQAQNQTRKRSRSR